MKSNKSLFLTYVFWLFGGLFGLHHFYLNRYRHAFAQWISFGGYFGVGWIRDLWRIPEYVLEANEDPEYMVTLIDRMRRQPKPSFGIIRFLASVIVADILGYLVMGAIPHELFSDSGSSDNLISRVLTTLFVPLGCAIGKSQVKSIYKTLLIHCSDRCTHRWQCWKILRLNQMAPNSSIYHLSIVLLPNEPCGCNIYHFYSGLCQIFFMLASYTCKISIEFLCSLLNFILLYYPLLLTMVFLVLLQLFSHR